jgi:hypothetical protein
MGFTISSGYISLNFKFDFYELQSYEDFVAENRWVS